MTVTLEGGCRVSDMREGEPAIEGTLGVWNRLGRATGARAISLRIMEFAPGLSPGIRNGDCDEILYLLDEWRQSDPGGVEDSSQGQALSEPPLDQEQFIEAHPEGVRRNFGLTRIFINGHPYEVGPDAGANIDAVRETDD